MNSWSAQLKYLGKGNKKNGTSQEQRCSAGCSWMTSADTAERRLVSRQRGQVDDGLGGQPREQWQKVKEETYGCHAPAVQVPPASGQQRRGREEWHALEDLLLTWEPESTKGRGGASAWQRGSRINDQLSAVCQREGKRKRWDGGKRVPKGL